jgi:hypothetical protein
MAEYKAYAIGVEVGQAGLEPLPYQGFRQTMLGNSTVNLHSIPSRIAF